MKLLLFIIIVSCTSLQLLGQTNNSPFFNSSFNNYSKTDFSKVDSLNCWFYVLTVKNSSHKDSVQSIGELAFQRTHSVEDAVWKFRDVRPLNSE